MRVASGIVVASIIASIAAPAAPASAQELRPITDRDWALDIHDSAAIGTVRIVGMGGTSLAVSEGSAGVLTNPASAAVRRTTSLRHWGWDFHIDALSAVSASDFDNNGLAAGDEFGVRVGTAGIVGLMGPWGLAFVVTSSTARLDGPDEDLDATGSRAKVALARSFDGRRLTVGAAVRLGTLEIETAEDDPRQLFSLTGSGLEVGAVWQPPVESWRVGGSLSLPVSADNVDTAACDPMNCEGYILPERAEVPWQVAVGAAFRQARTPWNQLMAGPFRDEKVVLVAADLVMTGPVADGYGLEAFGRRQWQRSGRHTSFSGRVGAELEVVPGRLRLRGGTYWEPGRFVGVGGRPHLTAGVELGFFDFHFFGRRRLRLSVTGDMARRYGNAGLSVGFWH
jgi:hypothetical protein